ncbi:MAG: DUF2577 domain-containing protein [Lysinibacillus sp.]
MNFLASMIKKAAVEAVSNTDPMNVRHGTVISTSPLKIQIDQKLILGIAQLKLTKIAKDYDIEMSVNGGAKQVYTVYNALKMHDKVTLLKAQGGQQYLIIDKE